MALHLRALRLLPFLMTIALLVAAFATGCGRSDLLADSIVVDAGSTDSGKDGGPGSCNVSTCPSGCCDTAGKCRTGTDVQACGEFGQQCSDCLGLGFTSCDGMTHACTKQVDTCDQTTCPTGCCFTGNSGSTFCVDGSAASQCGASGATCQDCTQFNDICDPGSRTCIASGCNATTCADGCCVGGTCQHGGQKDDACGLGGVMCDDCASRGQTCAVEPGGVAVCVGTPTCGPSNCKGCCIGDVCVAGGDDTACGLGGGNCANCAGKMQVCGAGGTCQAGQTCTAANCPGCCNGNSCVLMETDQACGKAGAACKPCPMGQTCNAGACIPQVTCGPASCPNGCCTNGVCAIGTQNTICGNNGAACTNCSANGQTCQGQACAKPVCSPANCAGCCSNGTCVLGSQDTACGNAGASCTDCTMNGLVCGAGGVCKQPCGPANCATGCCSGQSCVGGFIDNRCGSNGTACVDCTAKGSTCDTAANPRVCTAPNTCPAKYPGCAAGATETKLPLHQSSCSASDLMDASACSAGLTTASCQGYIAFLQANSPACATCLAPFEHDVLNGDYAGVFTCVAPFASTSCNHTMACEVDCVSKSCSTCPAGSEVTCDNNVQNTGGQCETFLNQLGCIGGPLSMGQGTACDAFDPPVNFDLGIFLQQVGALYCQP